MKKYDVIGLMSGTSLDGLDIAYVRFSHENNWQFQILECESINYDLKMVNELMYAYKLSGFELKKLDINYGKWIGNKTKKFMESRHISPELIVSHGHTIFHQPDIGLTLQIGDGYQIMLGTGIKTVCDLRSLDIALGGQGAPLVPVGDKLLFKDYEFCLNLGGFSNISFDQNGSRIAFDICPVNTVLNQLATQINLDFDAEGALAKTGLTNAKILKKLNELEFYRQNPPKSLGIEWVHENIFSILKDDSINNLLNTYCHHIAFQIILAIEKNYSFLENGDKPKMLITGGGAKNNFLINLLKTQASEKIDITIPEAQLIDFKEAIIFAFLGLLRSENKINTLKSVTGANMDSSGGLIFEQFNNNPLC